MSTHAISLSHPGIRCRCLAAYGDAVSAVKWASRLGREHHDDLAQFMLGMGYATEALHLPGISKRLEFDLAMQSNDLKRALQCLLTMSNSRDIGNETVGLNLNDIMSLTAKKEDVVEAVDGVVKFAKEFLDLIDAADATAQGEIAREALKRLAAAGSVKGALRGHELRGLALRLANHGELTRLGGLVNNLIAVGAGREAAFAAALLGDNALMEKAWQDTGMLAEAVLHAHAHGRPSLRTLVQAWNKVLQKEMEHGPSTTTDAAAAFLASLEEPKLTSLADAAKKLPIEILPPGMASLYAPNPGQKKTTAGIQGSLQAANKPLLLEGSNSTQGTTPTSESAAPAVAEAGAPPAVEAGASASAESGAPPTAESGEESTAPAAESGALPTSESGALPTSESGAPPTSESGAPPTSETGAPPSEAGGPPSETGVPPSETAVSESVEIPTAETSARPASDTGSNLPSESTISAAGPTSESSAAVTSETSERSLDNPSNTPPVSVSGLVATETSLTSTSNLVPTEAPSQLPVPKQNVRPELPLDFFT
nr:PREDICTED: mucin-2-like [Daucus carota subsp. sativus]